MGAPLRVGVVGDIHRVFDAREAEALDREGYDLLLFVGDLAAYRFDEALEVARAIARLRTPALVIPGNHDAVTGPQLASEVLGAPAPLRAALGRRMAARVAALEAALGPVPLVGYGLHPFEALGLFVVSARPHSHGGPTLAYGHYLERRFGVGSLEGSAARLCALFDAVPAGARVLVLAHSGPAGLGSARADPFGCDFRPEEGDFGDPDFAHALAHARARGVQVAAVAAGHMHHRLRGGGERRWQLTREDTLYLNAARVPRRRRGPEGEERHHLCLRLDGERAEVEARWLALPPR